MVKQDIILKTPTQLPKGGAHPNIIIIHRNFPEGAAPLPRFANKLSKAEELRNKRNRGEVLPVE